MRQTGTETLKPNLLLVLFLAIVPPLAFAQLTESKAIVDTIPDVLKIIPINSITDGSKITSAKITVTIDQPKQQLCFIKLLEESLDQIPISNNFPCKGTHTITLTQFGNWALETTLRKDNFNLGIGFIDDPKSTASFKISDYDISYMEPTYFAQVEGGKVITVIVADQTFVSNLPGTWIETKIDDSIRGKYAGIGFDYNPILDKFIDPNEKIEVIEVPTNSTEK